MQCTVKYAALPPKSACTTSFALDIPECQRPRASGNVGSAEAGGGAERTQREGSGWEDLAPSSARLSARGRHCCSGVTAHTCPEWPPGPLLHSAQDALLRRACAGVGPGGLGRREETGESEVSCPACRKSVWGKVLSVTEASRSPAEGWPYLG